MADPRDSSERVNEFFPAGAVAGEHAPAFGGDLVVPLAPLPGLLDPAAGNERAFFEPVEHRVQRRDVKLQHPAGPFVDQLSDFVAVPGAVFHQRQHQDLGAALDVRPEFVSHMWH
jgi:hypothetical protein